MKFCTDWYDKYNNIPKHCKSGSPLEPTFKFCGECGKPISLPKAPSTTSMVTPGPPKPEIFKAQSMSTIENALRPPPVTTLKTAPVPVAEKLPPSQPTPSPPAASNVFWASS